MAGMARISERAMTEVEEAFEWFRTEITSSQMTMAAKEVHLRDAGAFVRWLRYEFEPGITD